MNDNKASLIILLVLAIASLTISSSCSRKDQLIQFASNSFEIQINETGEIAGFLDLTSEVNHVSQDTLSPIMAIRVNGSIYPPLSASFEKPIINLTFSNGIEASIKVEENSSYITFELLSITAFDTIEVILWGPYNTDIGKTIGETVGVVRDDNFAIGIQSLNLKTLGGYPWNESDRMPAFDIFRQEDINNMHPDKDGSVLYRVEAAKPTTGGSSLQAYSRNRNKPRITQDFNHEKILAPPYNDGGPLGSRIALFGCKPDEVLDVISEIELSEDLPHPMIDGEWGKVSLNASAAYLITSFTEEDVEDAIALTKKAGLRHFYHYGKTFENWGHFDLFKGEFPNGIKGLKACVDKAKAQGVKLGTHFLSNFITTNDPYVTPIPDERLAKVGSSFITSDISANETEIPIESPDYFNQMKNNSLKTVKIGQELVRYGSVSKEAPWILLDCQRGAFGTHASSHLSGDTISKLLDHPYKVFLTNADLTAEMSKRIADLYNQTGLRQISFDGLEGNRSTGLGTYGESMMPYVWYNTLADSLKDHLIIDASRTTHFFWHIYTRMNWGEPWYGGFRESQTEYRFNNQAYFKRNYMPGMLGWFKMTAETSIEDIEWLLARSAGYDAGYALVADQKVIAQNGNSDKILSLIGDWEQLRLSGSFSETQKKLLRDNNIEFTLNKLDEGQWTLKQIPSNIFRHEKMEKQPGEPVHSTYQFSNDGNSQNLSFIISPVNCNISGITLELDNYKTVRVETDIKDGQILKYEGGINAVIYSSSWQKIGEVEINQGDLMIDKGDHAITFDCKFSNLGEDPYVVVETRTVAREESIRLNE